MRRRSLPVSPVLLSAALVGCAQILGIDSRSLGPDGGASQDGAAEDATKPDARPRSDATSDGMSKRDVAAPSDASPGHDAGTGADHELKDAAEVDSAREGGDASHDASSDAAKDAGLTMCDGGAVDLDTDPRHCAMCSHVCPEPEAGLNEQPTCTGGVCGTGCMSGFGNCNDGGTGCSFELSMLTDDCGACGNFCGNAGTTSVTCVDGACVFQCSPGFLHCGTDDSTGCIDISQDDNNCGYCGYSCGSGKCTHGICKLTGGGEQFAQNLGVSALIQDSTTEAGGSLYWVVIGSTQYLRRMHKDGSGLVTLNGGSPPPPSDLSIAVDQHNVYYFENNGRSLYAESVGDTSGANISLPGLVNANGSASGFLCDGDLNHAATGVFFAQGSAGLWRASVPPSAANLLQLATDGPVVGLALWGQTLYFSAGAAGSSATLESVTTTQTTTGATTLTSVTNGATAIATDGMNIYAIEYSPAVVSRISIATKNRVVLVTNGPGEGNIATDGTNVYIGSGSVYRVLATATDVSLSATNTIFLQSTFGAGAIYGLQVDDKSVYFATDFDVWKTKK